MYSPLAGAVVALSSRRGQREKGQRRLSEEADTCSPQNQRAPENQRSQQTPKRMSPKGHGLRPQRVMLDMKNKKRQRFGGNLKIF